MTAVPLAASRARLPRGAGRDAAGAVGTPSPAVPARTRFVVPLVLLLTVQACTLTAALTATFPH